MVFRSLIGYDEISDDGVVSSPFQFRYFAMIFAIS